MRQTGKGFSCKKSAVLGILNRCSIEWVPLPLFSQAPTRHFERDAVMSLTRKRARILAVLVLSTAWAISGRAQQITISGRFVDPQRMPVPGAEFTLGSERVVADSIGRFQLSVQPGEYPATIIAEGFCELRASVKVNENVEAGDLPLWHWDEIKHCEAPLSYKEVLKGLFPPNIPTFTATGTGNLETSKKRSASGSITRRADQRLHLNNEDMVNDPFPASQDYRNALALLPNVLFDQLGQFHLNGGTTKQADIRLDGFDIVDPQTNYLQARMSVDAVQGVETTVSGRTAGTGRGSAGDLNLTTARTPMSFRYLATDFIPSITTEQGIHVDRWTPRALLEVPLGAACVAHGWLEEAVDAFYHVNLVNGLPQGQNLATSWDMSSLTHAGYELGRHSLTGTFLYNRSHGHLEGLSITSPAESTTERLEHLFFSGLKDHIGFANGWLEIGIADHRADTRIDPQGSSSPFEFTPNGRSGDYFIRSRRSAQRQQTIVNGRLGRGHHFLESGIQIERPSFGQTTDRTGFRVVRADGTVVESVNFTGSTFRSNRNWESTAYVRGGWDSGGAVHLEGGLRADRDSYNGSALLGPQFGFALLPWAETTKIRANWGRYFDHADIDLLSFNQDQTAAASFYDAAGTVVRTFTGHYAVDQHKLRTPQSDTVSAGIERRLFGGLGTVSYVHRLATNQYVFVPSATGSTVTYELANGRRQTYDAVQVTADRTFSRGSAFIAYVRSRNHSNALVDYSIDSAIAGAQQGGPTAWDAPNRLFARGWVVPNKPKLMREKIFGDTTIGYFAEYRSGYPFTIANETQEIVGAPNSRRYPDYMSLDVSVEQRVRLFGRWWAARLMVVNLTDRLNPVSVVNDIDSPQFLQYGRGQKRSYSFRLRLLDSLKGKSCSPASAGSC